MDLDKQTQQQINEPIQSENQQSIINQECQLNSKTTVDTYVHPPVAYFEYCNYPSLSEKLQSSLIKFMTIKRPSFTMTIRNTDEFNLIKLTYKQNMYVGSTKYNNVITIEKYQRNRQGEKRVHVLSALILWLRLCINENDCIVLNNIEKRSLQIKLQKISTVTRITDTQYSIPYLQRFLCKQH